MMTSVLSPLRGKRVGLVTNQSSFTSDWRSSRLHLHETIGLSCLYAPEHGLGGYVNRGEGVADTIDSLTGLPVRSLYQGEKGQRATSDDLDCLIFDIQDVGVRFYTYISTLRQIMETGVPVIVIDRPNPLGGRVVEGVVLQATDESFIGPRGLPIRYALTIGELAHWMNEEYEMECDLATIDLPAWQRDDLWWNKTDPWIMTSPAIAHQEGLFFYPGMCLLEGTNLHEGRGTGAPFELLGAPFIDSNRLADEVRRLDLDGVVFTPISYTPHGGDLVHGLYGHITDVRTFMPVETAVRILSLIVRMYPKQVVITKHFRALAGFDPAELEDSEKVVERMKAESADFATAAKRFHRYD